MATLKGNTWRKSCFDGNSFVTSRKWKLSFEHMKKAVLQAV